MGLTPSVQSPKENWFTDDKRLEDNNVQALFVQSFLGERDHTALFLPLLEEERERKHAQRERESK